MPMSPLQEPSSQQGYLRELVLLYPNMAIHGTIPGTITQIQRLDNRRAVTVNFTCEPKITEFLRSLAKLQGQFRDDLFFELKTLRHVAQTRHAAELSIYFGRVNLASQIDAEHDQSDRELSVSMELDERVSSQCDFKAAGQQFFRLTASRIEACYTA